MDPSEVEFLGEKQLVSIVPNFSFGVIHLISGSIGPFRAGLPVRVPIWIALSLKQQQKCRIVAQEWMDMEKLTEILEEEKQSKLFTRMPNNHFMDEAQMLLTAAPDDIPDVDNIRTIIKDIWDLRMAKLRSSVIGFVKNEGTYAKLDHLTAMEINSIRSLLPDALDIMLHMEQAGKSAASQSLDATLQ
ncbi:probable DNA replication complex GINS protein PSF2 [Nasonia vitripennis]|uniref:DNA replication complex GINS protein PSF2 n=1 Tax=Nasonia vitripennis TaxID=7425 RepID=A0A7M7QQM3_NASVI|nr:probable DNA replication complex GINS protein PSF2 [Nasonia vitripennis]XP_031779006.1 probable DNA replication complex GINS protein PSF2 [Nasonia vitripennis]XP_032452450.1 probable DNA replication complex GINS protein PSF2 [Nasonia vitripennis]